MFINWVKKKSNSLFGSKIHQKTLLCVYTVIEGFPCISLIFSKLYCISGTDNFNNRKFLTMLETTDRKITTLLHSQNIPKASTETCKRPSTVHCSFLFALARPHHSGLLSKRTETTKQLGAISRDVRLEGPPKN